MFEVAESSSLAVRRAEASRAAIVDAAWLLSRSKGLTGWSLRELAREVGVTAPTLYAYVDSKHAIYDEMFRAGWETFGEMAEDWPSPTDASVAQRREAFKTAMRAFVEFATSDSARYHLMYQRVIPDFVPSERAYAASLSAYGVFRQRMAEVGVTDQADLDLWTAVSTGLTAQQISNDPGGDRWSRLVDVAVDMFCDHVGVRMPDK